MSRFKLIILFGFFATSCCKDTEIIKYENPNVVFSIYSSLYMENTTIHKSNNKLKRVIFNNGSYYDNIEYFSNDSSKIVRSKSIIDSSKFSFKNILSKDTLIFTNNTDTIYYLFENDNLKSIKMSYNKELYIINSYSHSQIDITLLAGNNQIKQADYKIILDTASYQDFYPQSFYEFIPPLNYLRYYTDFYNLNFPKLSYKSISIKSYTSLIASDDINVNNEFDNKGRIMKSYINRVKYPKRNDTLSYNYFE